jgi:hypothetical protein
VFGCVWFRALSAKAARSLAPPTCLLPPHPCPACRCGVPLLLCLQFFWSAPDHLQVRGAGLGLCHLQLRVDVWL